VSSAAGVRRARIEIPSKKKTLVLTHYGRRSGKPFEVKIWFASVDGELWIGSLDQDRNWVRNVRHSGRARVAFDNEAFDVRCQFLDEEATQRRYFEAIALKYPIQSRLIGLLVRGKKPAVFRLRRA
jgi:deazaflavin-dependent oxidoreductase (nitroreductase family)